MGYIQWAGEGLTPHEVLLKWKIMGFKPWALINSLATHFMIASIIAVGSIRKTVKIVIENVWRHTALCVLFPSRDSIQVTEQLTLLCWPVTNKLLQDAFHMVP